MSTQTYPIIKPGQRVLAAGRSGSGKSTLARWLLTRSPLKWVILNPKGTKAYDELPDTAKINSLDMGKIEKALKDRRVRYVIVNPNSSEIKPDVMDDFILELHNSWTSVGLCCDELYTLHKNGVAGQGLIAWLTRGRELKQSFLGLTQRPAWISQFLFSESNFILGMSLNLQKDRNRMYEMTEKEEYRKKLKALDWLWYNTDTEDLNYFGPVPIDG